MNKLIIVLVVILAIVASLLVAYLVIGEPKWIDDEWGTAIEIGYADGSTDEVASILGITYSDKEVSYFKYTLSRKDTNSEFDTYTVDLSSFFVGVSIMDSDGSTEWTADITYGDDVILTLDNQWHVVYELIVESSDVTLTDGSYTLTFTPEGSITKEMPDGTSQNIQLPDGKSLTFTVEISNGSDKWINVEFSSGKETH